MPRRRADTPSGVASLGSLVMMGLLAGCIAGRPDAPAWCEARTVPPSPRRDACLAETAARRRTQERIRSAGEAAAMGAAIGAQSRYW
jgi:hypothetical protein